METYHVHRNILAIGERRSGYFANLFHYGIDDGDHCTNIELSPRAATYFPDLLDYMYESKAFVLTTRNAVSLLFLAQAFQVASLQNKAEDFIEKDIECHCGQNTNNQYHRQQFEQRKAATAAE